MASKGNNCSLSIQLSARPRDTTSRANLWPRPFRIASTIRGLRALRSCPLGDRATGSLSLCTFVLSLFSYFSYHRRYYYYFYLTWGFLGSGQEETKKKKTDRWKIEEEQENLASSLLLLFIIIILLLLLLFLSFLAQAKKRKRLDRSLLLLLFLLFLAQAKKRRRRKR